MPANLYGFLNIMLDGIFLVNISDYEISVSEEDT